MAVWYLDNDDEITDAVARLRETSDEQVVFVVPPGSRIATGRINFKLLAREATSRDLRMAVASPDEQVRALATSAGVLAAPTPDMAEAALERGDEPPAATSDRAGVAATTTSPGNAASEQRGGRVFGWSGRRLAFTTVVVLGLVLGAGFAALKTLPTAEITLTPLTSIVGPIEVPVTATASVEETNAETGRIPAIEIIVPLSVDGVFASSGVESVEHRASGEVRFSSPAQEFDQQIVAGTRVHTPAGTEFQTTQGVTLPRSEDGTAALVSAPVEATESGVDGNVPAETISVVPSLENQGISVTNPAATSGGRFDETPRVESADYDAAAVDLQNRLAGALAAHLRDPANTPGGLTLFAETAVMGPVAHEPPADELVGSDTAEFELSGSVAARVLAVEEAVVDEVARDRLYVEIPEGMSILADSVSAEHPPGTADGGQIHFVSTATGTAYQLVDPEALLATVAGMPVSDAQAILAGLGATTVNVWPEFLGDLPDDPDRITLDVLAPSTME
jgi:hypothetical protein